MNTFPNNVIDAAVPLVIGIVWIAGTFAICYATGSVFKAAEQRGRELERKETKECIEKIIEKYDRGVDSGDFIVGRIEEWLYERAKGD